MRDPGMRVMFGVFAEIFETTALRECHGCGKDFEISEDPWRGLEWSEDYCDDCNEKGGRK